MNQDDFLKSIETQADRDGGVAISVKDLTVMLRKSGITPIRRVGPLMREVCGRRAKAGILVRQLALTFT